MEDKITLTLTISREDFEQAKANVFGKVVHGTVIHTSLFILLNNVMNFSRTTNS